MVQADVTRGFSGIEESDGAPGSDIMKARKLIRAYSAKLILEAAIKSLLVSLAFALFVEAVFLAVCHIILFEPSWQFLLLIGGTSTLACFLFSGFILFFPSIKKTARRIDSSGLEERVSTMLQFEKDESGMAGLQKRDAVTKLHAHSTKLMKFAFPVKMFVTLAIACTLSVGMYFMPYFYPEPVEADEYEQLLDDQQKIIDDLINRLYDEIANANVPEDLKEKLNAIVDDLAARVSREDSTVKKLAEIDKTSRQIADIIASYIESDRLSEELKAWSATDELGEAIASGDPDAVDEAIENIINRFEGLEDDELTEALSELAEAFTEAGESSETEGTITDAIRELGNALSELLEDDTYSDSALVNEASEAFRRAASEIRRGLEEEAERRRLEEALAEAEGEAQEELGNSENPDEPGGEPGEEPGGEPGEEPGEEPGGEPGEEPGGEPGEEPGGEPGEEPGGEPGEEPGGEPGEEPGGEPGEEPGGEPGEEPGGEPGEEPGGEPGEEPGGEPGEEPGGEPGEEPGGEPGEEPGGEPGEEPGGEPGEEPGGEPGEEPGGEPGGEPGEGGSGEPVNPGGGEPEEPEEPGEPASPVDPGEVEEVDTEGEVNYASEEQIFSPQAGENAAYGDYLTEYYARALTAYANGEISEEEWNIAYAYYTMLYNNIPEESEEIE